ncbi:hypothetical protein ALC62_15443 [Cyphomyrmex costatus]|uniref:Uncharacterized protein n=1 Tax=Cyphomyrmex costatus TaxID=456900 RepID=A0A151I772_9HYME|nr:hypothetical protein ALC62_15443 [Cyphomyrmex costatus]
MPKIFLIKNRLHQQQLRLLESQHPSKSPPPGSGKDSPLGTSEPLSLIVNKDQCKAPCSHEITGEERWGIDRRTWADESHSLTRNSTHCTELSVLHSSMILISNRRVEFTRTYCIEKNLLYLNIYFFNNTKHLQ